MYDFIVKHLDLIAMVLGATAIVMHYVAPRTKNTYDDKVVEGIDFVIGKLPKKPAPESK